MNTLANSSLEKRSLGESRLPVSVSVVPYHIMLLPATVNRKIFILYNFSVHLD